MTTRLTRSSARTRQSPSLKLLTNSPKVSPNPKIITDISKSSSFRITSSTSNSSTNRLFQNTSKTTSKVSKSSQNAINSTKFSKKLPNSENSDMLDSENISNIDSNIDNLNLTFTVGQIGDENIPSFNVYKNCKVSNIKRKIKNVFESNSNSNSSVSENSRSVLSENQLPVKIKSKTTTRKPLSPLKVVSNFLQKISPLKRNSPKSAEKSNLIRMNDENSPPENKVNKAMRRLNLDGANKVTSGLNIKNRQKIKSDFSFYKNETICYKKSNTILTTPPKLKILCSQKKNQNTPDSIIGSPCFSNFNKKSESPISRKIPVKRTISNSSTQSIINQIEVKKIYSNIKAKLTNNQDSEFVGRESELQIIENFLKNSESENSKMKILKNTKTVKSKIIKLHENSHSMYISGAPGTGKTCALLNLSSKMNKKPFKIINCMEHSNNIFELYSVIYQNIQPDNTKKMPKTIKTLQTKIEEELLINTNIIILDEIDRLANEKHKVGVKRNVSSASTSSICSNRSNKSNISNYSGTSTKQTPQQAALIWLFSLCTKTKLILISIANTLDFTQRSIPELYELLEENNRPILLNFKPYTNNELRQIVNCRLNETKNKTFNILPNPIISYTCMKISNQYGDVRRVLDVLKNAIEIVESTHFLRKNSSISVVDIKVINKVLDSGQNNVQSYFSTKNKMTDRQQPGASINSGFKQNPEKILTNTEPDSEETALPIQQALILVSIFRILKKSLKSEVEFNLLENEYLIVCKTSKMSACNNSEIVSILENLHDLGFVSFKNFSKNRSLNKYKISLNIEEKDVKLAFEDKALLSKLF